MKKGCRPNAICIRDTPFVRYRDKERKNPVLEVVLYLLKQFVLVLVEVLDLAMLIRAVLSWIDPMEEGGFSTFMVMITEPIILPFRKLCAARPWFEGSPLDVPFFMALLALILLRLLLLAL